MTRKAGARALPTLMETANYQGFRYELDPNNKQRTLLAKHAGCARFAFNWGLRRRIDCYRQTGSSPNAIELHRELNRL